MTVLGIDIGGTQIKAGVVDGSGAVIASRTLATPPDLEGFRDALGSIVAEFRPGGIGFGCKGIINPADTRVEVLPGTLHFLEGLYLRDFAAGGIRVEADNDARVALAGEVIWGAARGRRNVLMLTLGTGVGGAVLADGHMLRGHTGVAGHLGHLTVDPAGPPCICGNHGCLETAFSARAIESEARAAVHRGCDSSLTRDFRADAQRLTCRAVFQAAAQGDAIAGLILKRAITQLGAALAGLLHLLDPEVVIVGGQIAEAGAALLDPLRAEIGWRTGRMLRREVPLVPPGVADKSGIVGAAALVLCPPAHP